MEEAVHLLTPDIEKSHRFENIFIIQYLCFHGEIFFFKRIDVAALELYCRV
jgi:hypothetical protein